MDISEIMELVEAVSAYQNNAPTSPLFESRAVSLDFLMEFGALGSDASNPETLLIKQEEEDRIAAILLAFLKQTTN